MSVLRRAKNQRTWRKTLKARQEPTTNKTHIQLYSTQLASNPVMCSPCPPVTGYLSRGKKHNNGRQFGVLLIIEYLFV